METKRDIRKMMTALRAAMSEKRKSRGGGASSRRAFFLQRCMKTPAQYAAMRLSEVKSLRKKL